MRARGSDTPDGGRGLGARSSSLRASLPHPLAPRSSASFHLGLVPAPTSLLGRGPCRPTGPPLRPRMLALLTSLPLIGYI